MLVTGLMVLQETQLAPLDAHRKPGFSGSGGEMVRCIMKRSMATTETPED